MPFALCLMGGSADLQSLLKEWAGALYLSR